MLSRRHLLLPVAAAPVVALAVAGVRPTPASADGFHLPLDPRTAHWRTLSQVRRPDTIALREIPADVRALDGRPLTLRGFLNPLDGEGPSRRFLLTANPVGCPGCRSPGAATSVEVRLPRPHEPTGEPVDVSGTLRLAPRDWILFRIEGAVLVG
jgi:hypothetical protein